MRGAGRPGTLWESWCRPHSSLYPDPPQTPRATPISSRGKRHRKHGGDGARRRGRWPQLPCPQGCPRCPRAELSVPRFPARCQLLRHEAGGVGTGCAGSAWPRASWGCRAGRQRADPQGSAPGRPPPSPALLGTPSPGSAAQPWGGDGGSRMRPPSVRCGRAEQFCGA